MIEGEPVLATWSSGLARAQGPVAVDPCAVEAKQRCIADVVRRPGARSVGQGSRGEHLDPPVEGIRIRQLLGNARHVHGFGRADRYLRVENDVLTSARAAMLRECSVSGEETQ